MREYKSYSREYKLKSEQKDFKQVKISSSEDAYKYASQFYFDDIDIYESVFVILLNTAGNTIGYAKISQGGINLCSVDKKLVCKYAIESLASAVILVHNHPTGKTMPSKQDEGVTKEVSDALSIVGCKLLDHIIITRDSHYSFQDNGQL